MSSFSSFLGIPCRIAGKFEFLVGTLGRGDGNLHPCGGNETRRNAD